MAKKAAVEAAPVKEKKVKKEVEKTLGTKEVAAKLKIDPKAFRVYLRETGANDGAEHKRYSWPLDTDFAELRSEYDAYYEGKKEAREAAAKKAEKSAKKTEKAKPAAAAKPAAKKTAKKAKPEPEEEEEPIDEEEIDEL